MFRDLTSLKIQSYTQKLVLSAATHQQQKYVSVCYSTSHCYCCTDARDAMRQWVVACERSLGVDRVSLMTRLYDTDTNDRLVVARRRR